MADSFTSAGVNVKFNFQRLWMMNSSVSVWLSLYTVITDINAIEQLFVFAVQIMKTFIWYILWNFTVALCLFAGLKLTILFTLSFIYLGIHLPEGYDMLVNVYHCLLHLFIVWVWRTHTYFYLCCWWCDHKRRMVGWFANLVTVSWS